MNVDDYQQEAMSLLNPALNPQDVLENALMGLRRGVGGTT